MYRDASAARGAARRPAADVATILLVILTFVTVPLHASGLIVVQGYGFAVVLVMASCILGAPAALGAVITMLLGVARASRGDTVRHLLRDFGVGILEAQALIA